MDRSFALRAEAGPPISLPHATRVAPRALAAPAAHHSFAAVPRTGVPAATGLQVTIPHRAHGRDGGRSLLTSAIWHR